MRLRLRWRCGVYFFFQAEDGIRDLTVTGVQTCALPIYLGECPACRGRLEEQGALIARASELLALAAPPARDVPPLSFRPGDAQPPPPARWPARLPLAWAATVVLALAAGWYLRGESPIAPAPPASPAPPARPAAAANAAAPALAAGCLPP